MEEVVCRSPDPGVIEVAFEESAIEVGYQLVEVHRKANMIADGVGIIAYNSAIRIQIVHQSIHIDHFQYQHDNY